MLKPSIDELLKKVDSQYTLVVAAARRARSIQNNDQDELVKNRAMKPVSTALEELLNDRFEFQSSRDGVSK